MTSWPAAALRKKSVCDGFSIRPGGEGAAAQDGYAEDEKRENWKRHLDLCLTYHVLFFFLWRERLKAMKSSLSEAPSTRGSDGGRHVDDFILYHFAAFV